MTFPMSREWLRNLISDYGRHRLFFIWNWTQIFYELSTSQYKESKVPEHKEILRYFCSIFERFFSHVKLQSNYCTYSHIWVSTLYVKFCTKHDQKGKERQIARNTSTILPSWHLFGFMSIITKIRKGMLGHLSFMINGEEGGGGVMQSVSNIFMLILFVEFGPYRNYLIHIDMSPQLPFHDKESHYL